jgi:hypothetical protein
MANYTSTQSGIWDEVATWGGGGFPVDGDNATNANTHTVTLDSTEICADLDVQAGGTLALSTERLTVKGNLTFGTTSDVTGSGEFLLNIDAASKVYTNNKTGAFSFTGTVNCRGFGNNRLVVTGNWSNANMLIECSTATDRSFQPASGTLKIINFTITNSGTGKVEVNCNVNNLSFEISGDIDLHAGAGVYTTQWDKGTGSITLTGGAANIAMDGQTLEAVVLNCAGATKSITENFSVLNFSGSGGVIQSSAAGVQRTITATNTGTASNCTFKDINFGSANRVNAKTGGTNNGNNLGIVFNDFVE